MESKSFRSETYRMYLSVQENHETIAKGLSKLSQGSTQILPYHSRKLFEHYEDHRIQYLQCQEILV